MRTNVQCKLSSTCELASDSASSEECPSEFRTFMKGQNFVYPNIALFYVCGGRDCLKAERNLSCTQSRCWINILLHYLEQGGKRNVQRCCVELGFKSLDKLFLFEAKQEGCSLVGLGTLVFSLWIPSRYSDTLQVYLYPAGVSCGLSGACFAFSWRGPLGGRRYLLLST